MSWTYLSDAGRSFAISAARIAFALAMITLIIDQASKYYVVEVLHLPESGRIAISEYVQLIFIYNVGISYSLMSDNTILKALSLAIRIALTAFLLFLVFGANRRLTAMAVGLILGGALGNLTDQMHLPGPIAFLVFSWDGYMFSALNFADISVFVGTALLIIDQLFIAGTVHEPVSQRVANAARPRFQP